MNPAWFKRADWPTDWEIQRRANLMDAIRAIPGGASLSDDDAEGRALWLWDASIAGRNEEAPRNRPASRKASEDELSKVADLAARLADHLDALHRPSVDALWVETGGELWNIAQGVRELADAARCAQSAVAAPTSARGARAKIEAAEVAEVAALIFEQVAGRPPTFTSDPDTNDVRGPWPAFLAATFKALDIKASVPAQVRAAREKSRPKNGI